MGNKKKKYVSPLMEELGLESEVQLLTISQNTRTTLKSMSTDNTFDDSSTGARESAYGFVFDEE